MYSCTDVSLNKRKISPVTTSSCCFRNFGVQQAVWRRKTIAPCDAFYARHRKPRKLAALPFPSHSR